MSPETLHPSGWFMGEITDHGFSEAQTGASQLFIRLRSEEGDEITAFLALTEKAVEWTVKKLRACGYQGFDFEELRDGSLLRGNQVRYQVTHEVYDGITRAKVGWINDPNSSGVERSDVAASNARRFNALLRQIPPAGQLPQAPPPKTHKAAPRRGAPAPATDADAPF